VVYDSDASGVGPRYCDGSKLGLWLASLGVYRCMFRYGCGADHPRRYFGGNDESKNVSAKS